jgi:LemA protein
MVFAVSSGLIIGVVIAAIAALFLFILVGMYNGLVRKRNRSENAWAQVDVQLKRRHDLIPNLVETVKGYAAHERGTFDEVTQARTAAQQAQGPQAQAQAENVLTQALGKLFAVAENYPTLRATENFQQLQAQLSETESNIAVSRQVYNDTVLTYDNALQTLPTSIVAGIFNFRAREYFQADDGDRAVPQVSFAAPPADASAPPVSFDAPPPAPAQPAQPSQPPESPPPPSS